MKGRRISESRDVDGSPPSGEAHHDADTPATTDDGDQRPTKTRRTLMTRNACIRCRLAKTKCSGSHPACARCLASGVRCVYDVTSEGITKMQNLQQKLESKTKDLGRVMAILNVLQSGSDQEATEVLARLRLGESVDQMAEFYESRRASLPSLPNEQDRETPAPQLFGTALHSCPPSPVLSDTAVPFILAPDRPFEGSFSSARRSTVALPLPQVDNSVLQQNADRSQSSTSALSAVTTAGEERYRNLPQISFNGCVWPTGDGSSRPAHRPVPRGLTYPRTYEPLIGGATPRKKPSRSFEGYLWPCSTEEMSSATGDNTMLDWRKKS